ncbi:MAG: hypothetical protein WA817_06870, partial [Candidatus Acidiferrum sp.]
MLSKLPLQFLDALTRIAVLATDLKSLHPFIGTEPNGTQVPFHLLGVGCLTGAQKTTNPGRPQIMMSRGLIRPRCLAHHLDEDGSGIFCISNFPKKTSSRPGRRRLLPDATKSGGVGPDGSDLEG